MKRNPVDPYGRRSKDFRTRSIPYIKKAALMNEGARVLKELFNRPYRMDKVVKHNTPYLLEVISSGYTDDGKKIEIRFLGTPSLTGELTNLMEIDVSFSVDGKTNITDEGDAFRIFSTVIDQMKEFDEEYEDKIDRLSFRSLGDTRSRLYSTMIRRFSSQRNYIPKVINAGGGRTQFDLYKDI